MDKIGIIKLPYKSSVKNIYDRCKKKDSYVRRIHKVYCITDSNYFVGCIGTYLQKVNASVYGISDLLEGLLKNKKLNRINRRKSV